MLDQTNPRSTAAIAGHPIHPMLVGFPIAFFAATVVTDLAFTRTANPAWATASSWLLGAGLVMAALAALAGLTDFLGEARIRALRPAWLHMIGNVIVVLLELANLVIRLRAAAPTVTSSQLLLSVIALLILLFNGWMGWEMVYKHRVGIADD
jgi:uncharacterized membrane protein